MEKSLNYGLIAVLLLMGTSPLCTADEPFVPSTFHRTTPVTDLPPSLKEVGIVERYGEQVAVNSLKFKDQDGKDVTLANYLSSGKPMMLAMVYYNCPTLCNLLLNGFFESMKNLAWSAGGEFQAVAVSIDPSETPADAKKKRDSLLKDYGRPGSESGVHFLTGEESQIQALAKQIGFEYRWDELTKQWAHGAAIVALTPGGKISRYLFGVQFPARDMRLALLEASDGKVGTLIDKVILFCFQYNPQAKRYSLTIFRVVQASFLAMVLFMSIFFGSYWLKQRKGEVTS